MTSHIVTSRGGSGMAGGRHHQSAASQFFRRHLLHNIKSNFFTRSITSLDASMISSSSLPSWSNDQSCRFSIHPFLGASSASDTTNTCGQSHPLMHPWYHPPSLQDPIKQHWRGHTVEYSMFLNAICYFSMSKLLNRNFRDFLWNFGSRFSEQKFEIPRLDPNSAWFGQNCRLKIQNWRVWWDFSIRMNQPLIPRRRRSYW